MAKASQKIASDADAPEVYADGVLSVAIRRNVARIALTSERVTSPGDDPEAVVVGHVAMSVPGFLNLYGRMDSIVQQLREQGRLVVPDGGGEAAPAKKAAKKTAKKTGRRKSAKK